MTHAVGSLVQARGREWVVLPGSSADLLLVRPLGGTDAEETGIYVPLEPVEPARFDPPGPEQPGDYLSGRLLRDALRLGFRSSAGPFRSFARIAVEPRPYQLVPLLMALKLDPVRLLIADDVGVGKTVEAGLIARELIDRGEVRRLAVLCPPALAEQWQAELRDKFHLDAELVLPGTARRLERHTRLGESLFEVYPIVIVSTDFIKSDHHRTEFLRACPELVIVDEAHTCAWGGETRGGRHQRHQLVAGLARDPRRHLILVTATPHSGHEAAFRSLLALLDPAFRELPDDLSGPGRTQARRHLAAHFIQRRRADIHTYLNADTPFPERQEAERQYKLTPDYRRLLDRVLRYARELVRDQRGGRVHQRVRWWAALALLRSVASSPAAAAATLRSRAAGADTTSEAEADALGRRTVLDLMEDEPAEGMDLPPGGDSGALAGDEPAAHRRLLDLAREASALHGAGDAKLQEALRLVTGLLADGFQPIVFCRFIPTAEYVKDALRARLPTDIQVAAVTGLLPPAEREVRVLALAAALRRVLVCTDCLSEGVNLQEHFNAVLHYDLSWNPTRHEQREGRVDRYGQPSPTVRVLTLYGEDNPVDGLVLNVLLKKHKTIRSSLGISVPVPVDTDRIVEAVFEGLLLREQQSSNLQPSLPLFDELLAPREHDLLAQWDATADREKRSRTLFAQETIRVEEVARELHAVRETLGAASDVAAFTRLAVEAHKGTVAGNGVIRVNLREAPAALRDAVGNRCEFTARFELPVHDGEIYLSRTHPIVEGLATYVMDTALDPLGEGVARRCAVIRTHAVTIRTTLLVLRFRYHIIPPPGSGSDPLLAEDWQVAAFAGPPQNAAWLPEADAEALLRATPTGQVLPDLARDRLEQVLNRLSALQPHLDGLAQTRGAQVLAAHQRVRAAARGRVTAERVAAHLPADILGVYIYLPLVGAAS